MNSIVKIVFFIFSVSILAYFLSKYIFKVIKHEKKGLVRFLEPVENGIKKLLHLDGHEMNAKEYIFCIITFFILQIVALLIVFMFQGEVTNESSKMEPYTAISTAISFASNTNFQIYEDGAINIIGKTLGIGVAFFIAPGMRHKRIICANKRINSEKRKIQ